MNQSANDIAYSLAVWDAGSEPAFVAKMNALAESLGAHHTHYVDASGYDPHSVSTAADTCGWRPPGWPSRRSPRSRPVHREPPAGRHRPQHRDRDRLERGGRESSPASPPRPAGARCWPPTGSGPLGAGAGGGPGPTDPAAHRAEDHDHHGAEAPSDSDHHRNAADHPRPAPGCPGFHHAASHHRRRPLRRRRPRPRPPSPSTTSAQVRRPFKSYTRPVVEKLLDRGQGRPGPGAGGHAGSIAGVGHRRVGRDSPPGGRGHRAGGLAGGLAGPAGGLGPEARWSPFRRAPSPAPGPGRPSTPSDNRSSPCR